MFYLQENCPVCKDGLIGLLRCSDGDTIVAMCDECYSIWGNPGAIHEPPFVAAPPEYLLPGKLVAVSGGATEWATLEEILRAGLGRFASADREFAGWVK